MLLPINNVLDKKTVEQFRTALDKTTWEDGKITAGGQAKQVKVNQQIQDQSDLAIELGNHILKVLGRHPQFLSAALPKKIFPPKFNRYNNADHYGPHVDNAIMHLPDHQIMRTDLSCTLFLSDPKEYDGGELVIETTYGAQQVKLAAGDLILYPSTSLHQVLKVTKGARVCSFFWLESMIRDNQQREMLYTLDQSIQTLTIERGADDNEVRHLTGIYHNLIRLWASS
ncbi:MULTISPECIES: Fe2+-dependent dioxygenase [Cycloclasticus]|nr:MULTISPECIES: Fe2+-dependent dioxygenase [Cycloclasticus]ATI04038.1 Fe2+-dependent dioxygenase [Cycloclasticus sp. PY97N]